jgi:hypothetical protein
LNWADGSPEPIRSDTEQDYVGVGVRVRRVYSGNPRDKTRYVTARPGGGVRWRPLRNGFFSSYRILPSTLTVSRSRQMAGLGHTYIDALIDPVDMVDMVDMTQLH